MRTILFFDLPTLTSSDKKNYRNFVKEIKKQGFYMIQESVYVKMSIDIQNANLVINRVKAKVPPNGSIIALTITEKQFSGMDILLGSTSTDVLVSSERFISL